MVTGAYISGHLPMSGTVAHRCPVCHAVEFFLSSKACITLQWLAIRRLGLAFWEVGFTGCRLAREAGRVPKAALKRTHSRRFARFVGDGFHFSKVTFGYRCLHFGVLEEVKGWIGGLEGLASGDSGCGHLRREKDTELESPVNLQARKPALHAPRFSDDSVFLCG